MKLLLIEDESDLKDSIVEYLKTEGFSIETASNFLQGEDKISSYDYDCLIVDIGLPDGNGLSLIRQLKEKDSDAGVIIISAKNSLDDKLAGLDIGADDYLTKPFHLSELNARIYADAILKEQISLNIMKSKYHLIAEKYGSMMLS